MSNRTILGSIEAGAHAEIGMTTPPDAWVRLLAGEVLVLRARVEALEEANVALRARLQDVDLRNARAR